MKMLAWSVGVILASVAPAAADRPAAAPSSLRMRQQVERHWFAPHWHKRVAQAAPDQPAADPPADGTAPAADPSAAPVPAPAAPA
ncbi:MAG: cobalamin biosynthesis protein, partial [Kofleriaceae bacterium]